VHYRNPVTLTEWDCRLNIVPVRNGDGEVTVIVQTLRDVTQSRAAEKERQRAEALLKDLAMTDELTGLANRRSFTEVAERELRRAKRLGRPMAVAAIDVDHLKTINDTYGHAGGDQALVRLSETVTREIREIDVFARMGGDEFALLLTDASREQAYETVARIRGDLEDQPLTVDGEQVRVAISAGIASRDETVETLDQLLARADDALYEAKDAGRSRTELS
jgi:diguanylate cyclase (GGDEF)-like protein